MLYFAYGSNMNRAQMRARCPGACLLAEARIDGRLEFGSWSESWGGAVATVVPDLDTVPGLLYYVSRSDLENLDKCEGHPFHYRRVAVRVDCGRLAYTYKLPSYNFGLPSKKYLDVIKDVYEKYGWMFTWRGSDNISKVFVYGTLLRGESNHQLLGSSKRVGKDRISGFRMHDLGRFPAIVRGGKGDVFGEVYECDQRTIEALDRLEGHPRFYRRIVVVTESGAHVWVYVMTRAMVGGRNRIPSGDWLARWDERRCIVKIEVFNDRHSYGGNDALSVVKEMMVFSFGENDSPTEYINWSAGNIEKMTGEKLDIVGCDDATRAESFVAEIVRIGLARIVIGEEE